MYYTKIFQPVENDAHHVISKIRLGRDWASGARNFLASQNLKCWNNQTLLFISSPTQDASIH